MIGIDVFTATVEGLGEMRMLVFVSGPLFDLLNDLLVSKRAAIPAESEGVSDGLASFEDQLVRDIVRINHEIKRFLGHLYPYRKLSEKNSDAFPYGNR